MIVQCPSCGGMGRFATGMWSGDFLADCEWNRKCLCVKCNGSGRIVVQYVGPYVAPPPQPSWPVNNLPAYPQPPYPHWTTP